MITVTGLSKVYPGSKIPAVDEIDFEIEDGEFVSLLGPSGCGKTTTLRMLAGLERPTAGVITMDGELLSSSVNGTFRPVHKRPIGMVFQSYAIWPHMNVFKNVAFPLSVERPRIDRKEVRARVETALELVGLQDYMDRPAGNLSGGQQQRVALARAVVREPKLLLLDEPLSNLDSQLRARMREEIRAIQQRIGITTVLVTHDQGEALAISDHVIVMSGGHIVEHGLPQEVYTWPRDAFTANFLGVSNRFDGTVIEQTGDVVSVQTEVGILTCGHCDNVTVGEEVSVFIRPESFSLTRRKPDEPHLDAVVSFTTYQGDSWDYHVAIGDTDVKVRVYKEKVGLEKGETVHLVPDPGAAILMPLTGRSAHPDIAEPSITRESA
jgi:iron(III) transport system ATP-binding protein